MALKGKKAAFVLEYPIDLDGAKAARRAGYSAKTAAQKAWTLLQEPEIREAIDIAIAERAQRSKLDQTWVLDRLRMISDRCVQVEEVLDDEGKPIGEYQFNAAGANRATELIGKHLGMFKDKVELTGGLRMTHEEALAELGRDE